jgi:hypothetical protein
MSTSAAPNSMPGKPCAAQAFAQLHALRTCSAILWITEWSLYLLASLTCIGQSMIDRRGWDAAERIELVVWTVIVTSVVAAVGWGARWIRMRLVQRERDSRAHALYLGVLAGEISRYTLYLRPFTFDRRTVTNPGRRGNPIFPQYFLNRERAFEELLQRAMQPYGPMLAIGGGGNGVARVEGGVGDDWKSVFETLAAGAQSILLVPSLSPGLHYELDRLRASGQFAKCVLLIPSMSQENASSALVHRQRQYARALARAMNAHGIEMKIPPIDGTGRVARLDAHGRIVRTVMYLQVTDLSNALRALTEPSHGVLDGDAA